jgi:hypothetical protein
MSNPAELAQIQAVAFMVFRPVLASSLQGEWVSTYEAGITVAER